MISSEIAVPNISITDYLNFFTSYSLSRFQSTKPLFQRDCKDTYLFQNTKYFEDIFAKNERI